MMVRRAAPRLLFAVLAALTAVLISGLASPAAADFDDTRGTVFADAVDALAARDVVFGCGNGSSFCVADPIGRDQLASLLDRAYDLPEGGDGGFADVDGNVHAEAIDRAAAAGYLLGCADGAFCPDEDTSRGQAAAVTDRAEDLSTTSTRYFADGGYHAEAIDRVAAAGITDGCTAAPTRFCPGSTLTRGQAAVLLARSLDLVPRVTPQTLAEREDEEEQQRRADSQITDRYPDQVWDDLAECESGGNWSINTGNGYYGGLQFSRSSWEAVGGTGLPSDASREEQIIRGDRLQQRQGWGAWPHCSEQLGYR